MNSSLGLLLALAAAAPVAHSFGAPASAATPATAPAAVPRDRCDSSDISDDVGSFLYKDAPTEQVSQIVKPKATFAAEGKMICVQRGNMEHPRKIQAYQVESGAYKGFGYRIDYQHGYAKVTDPGEQDDILADEYWTVNCDVDSMSDKVSCYVNHAHLFLWYSGGNKWSVHVGDGRNYPASEIAVRLDDLEAILGKEPAFTAEQSKRVVEGLKAEPRVRTRFYKWPSGTGDDDFQAKGFKVAFELARWLHGSVRP